MELIKSYFYKVMLYFGFLPIKKYNNDIRDIKTSSIKELNKVVATKDLYKNIIEHTPEAIKYKFHMDNMVKKMNTKELNKSILFAYAEDIKGLKSMYPPKGVDADISSNLPMVYKEHEHYKDINEFIEIGLKYTFPMSSYKIENGFLNIKFKEDVMRYYTTKINATV